MTTNVTVAVTIDLRETAHELSYNPSSCLTLIEEIDDCVGDIDFTEQLITALVKRNRFDLNFKRIRGILDSIEPAYKL